ncbi:Not1 N-terminal domain, CCR4-Not complex component-domain-containing protein [Cunninghamella echinulata]|nr:Not1 N-terminal domain, CCR4-Not complex component-domain-containing protein [Cunninghamella echinulata]
MSMKKLQTEIDRVLKKVTEGVETFEAIFEKIHSTTNANQKEKYEQDLKKEIKKLQRLRDQIKTWIASNDIKDKRTLVENRKLIESQMERFKAIEKEMKTKAFSKEGLLQKEKMDPKEKEKSDACDWISNTVDELARQIETSEFELETLQGTTRKGKKDHQRQERVNEIEHSIERHRWHINRLELMLRLLENDHLEPEKVMGIRDDVHYYLECHQEPDFEEDEFIYEDLNLEEEEELFDIRTDEYHPDAKPEKELNDNDDIGDDDEEEIEDKSTKQTRGNDLTQSAWIEPPKIVDQSKQIKAPVENSSSIGSHTTHDVNESHLPSSLADLAASFESIKLRAANEDMLYTHQMLDASLQHVPDLIDSERPKIYQPRTPYPAPSYYPQQPLAIFDNPALFEKFDMDALFFIFYYQQGTYQQYLAAKELKKQSWRFHKKYLTWFQRHEEPKVITEDYEQGTYIYFDYEGAWCQRKKTEFRFEYRYLEEA